MKNKNNIPGFWNHSTNSSNVAIQMLLFLMAISPMALILSITPDKYDWAFMLLSFIFWILFIINTIVDYKNGINTWFKKLEVENKNSKSS